MVMTEKKRSETIRVLAEGFLDKVIGMTMNLTEDDSEYGLEYIGQKLTKVAAYLEQLGDVSIQLSKISLEVTRQLSEHKSN